MESTDAGAGKVRDLEQQLNQTKERFNLFMKQDVAHKSELEAKSNEIKELQSKVKEL